MQKEKGKYGKCRRDESKEKSGAALTTGIIIGMTVIVLGYVAYALVTKNINMQIFEVLLGIFVIGYLCFPTWWSPG